MSLLLSWLSVVHAAESMGQFSNSKDVQKVLVKLSIKTLNIATVKVCK